MEKQIPSVFISYSWEDAIHKEWVKDFADKLIKEGGINVIIDQYDLSLGDRLPQFMEQSITQSDFVLVVCTPKYKEKSDNRKGGVGYEGHIISDELLTKGNERKFIPIIRKGTASTAIPSCLSGKLGIDFSDVADEKRNYEDLITTIWGGKKKPVLGEKPPYVINANPNKSSPEEPTHILGVIVDEVTLPRMDGTRGSALYEIPFRLSKRPSDLWKKLFVRAWNMPPKFTTMHRPGIASVYGDKIILNGTTMEEVKKYHRDTLVLCVDLANEQEKQILKEQQRLSENENSRIKQHYDDVERISDDIKF